MAIKLLPASLDVVRKHAEAAFPHECCGFLYGSDAETRIVSLARSAENAKEGDQRRRFEISPQEYLRAELFALQNNLTLLGIYHSHPQHPAIASEHDLKQAQPFFSYLIASVMDGTAVDYKSWRLRDDERRFDEEQVLLPQTSIL